MAFRVFRRVRALERARASNRAVWRERLVAFTVFRRVRAPKRARHPTEQSGEQTSRERVRIVEFEQPRDCV